MSLRRLLEFCNILSNHVPGLVLDSIYALPAPSINADEGHVSWRLTSDGMFSHKYAYESLIGLANSPITKLFKWIGCWFGLESYRLFLWRVGNSSLLTNMARKRRGLTDTCTCVVCNQEDETIIHLMRDCIKVRSM